MSAKPAPGDFFELVKNYLQQELIDPLRPIPRWIAFGVGGSLLLMIGGISLTLASLRVLQEETGSTFMGNLSWIPPAITLFAASVVLVLLILQIKKRTL